MTPVLPILLLGGAIAGLCLEMLEAHCRAIDAEEKVKELSARQNKQLARQAKAYFDFQMTKLEPESEEDDEEE